MLGIFNRMIRTSTRTDDWDAPDHWKHQLHQSTYERQRRQALKHRELLERDIGLMR